MRIAPAVAMAGMFALLAACGSQTPANNYTNQPTTTATNQKTSGMQSGSIGEAATLQSGGTATVYSYNSPVTSTNQFTQPKAGNQFAYIDAEECAPQNNQKSANPYDFQLQMPDNTRIRPSPGWFKPDLNLTQLQPGECARGNVTYEVPQGQTPSAVYYGSGKDTAKWNVQ